MCELRVAFNITGGCTQTIRLYDNCPLSKRGIVDALNGVGKHVVNTRPDKGCEVVLYHPEGHLQLIGRVVESETSIMGTDFEELD